VIGGNAWGNSALKNLLRPEKTPGGRVHQVSRIVGGRTEGI
jgi:hypothetical protein